MSSIAPNFEKQSLSIRKAAIFHRKSAKLRCFRLLAAATVLWLRVALLSHFGFDRSPHSRETRLALYCQKPQRGDGSPCLPFHLGQSGWTPNSPQRRKVQKRR